MGLPLNPRKYQLVAHQGTIQYLTSKTRWGSFHYHLKTLSLDLKSSVVPLSVDVVAPLSFKMKHLDVTFGCFLTEYIHEECGPVHQLLLL